MSCCKTKAKMPKHSLSETNERARLSGELLGFEVVEDFRETFFASKSIQKLTMSRRKRAAVI